KLLNGKYAVSVKENEWVRFYKSNLESEVKSTEQQVQSTGSDETGQQEIEHYHKVLLDIYDQQRKALFQLRKEKHFSDEEIRKAEVQLDLNELRIAHF